jgi:hypothetical protein
MPKSWLAAALISCSCMARPQVSREVLAGSLRATRAQKARGGVQIASFAVRDEETACNTPVHPWELTNTSKTHTEKRHLRRWSQSQLTGAVRDYLLAGPASFGTEIVCALGRSPSLRSGTPFLRLNSNSSRVIPFVSGTNMATNTIASTQKPPNT